MTVDSNVRSSVETFPDGPYTIAYMAAMRLPIELQLMAMGDTVTAAKYSSQMGRNEFWEVICELTRVIKTTDCNRMVSFVFNFEDKVPAVRIKLYQKCGNLLNNVTLLFELDGKIVGATCRYN